MSSPRLKRVATRYRLLAQRSGKNSPCHRCTACALFRLHQTLFQQRISLPYPRSGCSLILALLFLGFSIPLYAQQPFGPEVTQTDLSHAPGREFLAEQSVDSQSTASISGTVLDVHGAMVPGAKIMLESMHGGTEHVEMADSVGFFSFDNLPAGSFKVTVTAPNLGSFESSEITLHAGERYYIPKIALSIATAAVDVTVTATEEQVATEQVQGELQQRVFGIFPNFYTSFVWNAAPLTPRLKFKLAIRSATDPVTFFTTGFLAGVQQARDTYPDYGQGAEGYGKRYGADYGDIFIGRMLGAAVLPTILHQDPRYFYQGTGSFNSRVWHALSSAFICRGDDGHREFNYSHILGNFAAGGISNLYRPEADRGVLLAVDNALLHTAANAAGNLVREFVLLNITTKVPAYAKGKHPPAPASSEQ